jgi:NAD-dependent dihydropyrimidine dehydrogenase PreA subunit
VAADAPLRGGARDGDARGAPRAPGAAARVRRAALHLRPRPAYLSRTALLPEPASVAMPYVITEACVSVKDKSCVDVCPVDCIYEGPDQLYIHPDECIDCGACEPECPVTAIFPEEDVPVQMRAFIQKNRDVFVSDAPPGRPTR